MHYRVENDTLGEVQVPADKFFGAQTQRSLENFQIGSEKMPLELIEAFAMLKKATAIANQKLGNLDIGKQKAIVQATEEILAGKYNDQFPLVVWQTGSGTHTNMNLNEVIAYRANQILNQKGETHLQVHPNDDVNKSQSSNDTFPTAMHMAAVFSLEDKLIPALNALKHSLQAKQEEFKHIIKIGRTHLQDATPLTLGQEISAWIRMLEKNEEMIKQSLIFLKELAIGGTAVGTGINAHPEFGKLVAEEINKLTGKSFITAKNKFHALTSHDELVFAHGALKALAADLMKIANDVRWLASGPRAGIGELTIPANEPGSSIMPGKVNPTQSEALTMVVCQVMGNDVTIGFAASQGNFQLNVFKPVIIFNFLQSATLLADAMVSFNKNSVQGIKVNEEIIKHYVTQSLMLVTALNPYIGYENAAKIAKFAFKEDITLKQAAVELNLLTEQELEQYLDPRSMIK